MKPIFAGRNGRWQWHEYLFEYRACGVRGGGNRRAAHPAEGFGTGTHRTADGGWSVPGTAIWRLGAVCTRGQDHTRPKFAADEMGSSNRGRRISRDRSEKVSTRAVAPVVAAPVAVLTPLQRPMLQRTCDCGEHTGGGECDDCKKKKKMPSQRHANGWAPPAFAPPIVHDVLRSPGQALHEGTQTYFGSRLGGDFSQVQVHTDERAAESARAVSALAYTVGNHLVFGAGRYSPADDGGRRRRAHELTHRAPQKDEAIPSPQYQLEVGVDQDRFEPEADPTAERVTGGMEGSHGEDSTLSTSHATARVQCAAATGTEADAGPTRTASPLLVEDDAHDLQSGQMRKRESEERRVGKECRSRWSPYH